jgi:hypothetical protein
MLALAGLLALSVNGFALKGTPELFLEVAPAWVPVTSGGFAAANFQAQVALGFRVWP